MVNKFKYKLTFYWHFCYLHAIYYHYNRRHALPSIEDIRMTDRWECHVFAFILAILEVNAFLILRYFVYYGLRQYVMPELLEFCRSWRGNLLTIYKLGNRGGG